MGASSSKPNVLDRFLCWSLKLACPVPPLIETIGGAIFFWMLALSNIFVMIMLVASVGGLVMRVRNMTRALATT
jgi:hypothetical protein